MRRALIVSAGLWLLAVGGPTAAEAHVHLTASVPADGSRVAATPDTVQLIFNSAVEERFARATLLDAAGRQRRLAIPRRVAPGRLLVALPAGVPRGTTIVSYRVLSTDGHPVAGAIAFDAGPAAAGAGAGSGAAASAMAGSSSTGPPAGRRASAGSAEDAAGDAARSVLVAARGTQYGALAVMLGGSAFLALGWLPALRSVGLVLRRPAERALARRWRIAARVATAAGAASALVALLAQAALDEGSGAALSVTGIGDVVTTRSGAAWAIAALAWTAVAAVLAAAGERADRPRALLALALPLAVLAVMPSVSGHAGRSGPLVAANVVHVCAASAWLGGLVALLLATRAAREPALARLRAALVLRFSAIALVAMAALTLTGGLQSALLLAGPGELLSTGYGRLLSLKIAITLTLLALGARQRGRAVRGAAGGTTIIATVRLEMVLGLLVLATTALLAGEIARG